MAARTPEYLSQGPTAGARQDAPGRLKPEVSRNHHEIVNPPPKPEPTKMGPQGAEARDRRYRGQEEARRILPEYRVEKCMRVPANRPGKRNIDVVMDLETGRAHYRGLAVCGSVWHCPVCAANVGAVRQEEIGEAAGRWVTRNGGAIAMMTLTVPHGRDDLLEAVAKQLRDAFSRTKRGNPWKRVKADLGIEGEIQAMEITYGENGWHPHFHVLLLVGSGVTAEGIRERILPRWQTMAEKVGLPRPSDEHGVQVTVRDDDQAGPAAAAYIAKEMTYGGSGRRLTGKGSWTPFGMLERIHELRGRDDEEAKWERRRLEDLFREYGEWAHGRRQIIWSKGLRDMLGMDEEAPDEELALEEPKEPVQVASLDRVIWRRILREGARVEVLRLIEAEGAAGLWRWCWERNLIPPRSVGPPW